MKNKQEINVCLQCLYSAVLSKIFEKMICDMLYSFLKSQNTVYENQYSNVDLNQSTNYALNCQSPLFTWNREMKQHVPGLLIDLFKTSDSTSHEKLLANLDHYEIRAIKLITSYLSNRYQYASCLDEESDNCQFCMVSLKGLVLGLCCSLST